jgi:hypothetical protein
VALVLAVIWLSAGTLAVVLGLLKRRWLPPVLGMIAIWYGLIWVRVFRERKQLRWPEGCGHGAQDSASLYQAQV